MKKRTYSFVDKDPVCDELASLVDSVGLRGRKHTGKIAILGTCAKATVDGILYGDTKTPRNSTVMGIATGLGFERRWHAAQGKWNLEEELAKARAFIKAQRALMEKPKKPRVRKTARRKKTKLRLVSSRAA